MDIGGSSVCTPLSSPMWKDGGPKMAASLLRQDKCWKWPWSRQNARPKLRLPSTLSKP